MFHYCERRYNSTMIAFYEAHMCRRGWNFVPVSKKNEVHMHKCYLVPFESSCLLREEGIQIFCTQWYNNSTTNSIEKVEVA
jgi:hypothetical protein